MKYFEKLKQVLHDMEPDCIKFYEKGNKAAGTRIRKDLQTIKQLAQEMRLEVQNTKSKL